MRLRRSSHIECDVNRIDLLEQTYVLHELLLDFIFKVIHLEVVDWILQFIKIFLHVRIISLLLQSVDMSEIILVQKEPNLDEMRDLVNWVWMVDVLLLETHGRVASLGSALLARS